MPSHTSSSTDVSAFIRKFIAPPKGNSPEEIKKRILHWIDVANHPENHSEDKHPLVIAAKRKTARQNVTRLAQRHKDIAALIDRESGAAA